MLNRRQFSAAAATTLCGAAARAQFRVEISGVGATQVPIAIARFRDEDRSGQSISGIVRAELERSGYFRIVEAPVVLPRVRGGSIDPLQTQYGPGGVLARNPIIQMQLWIGDLGINGGPDGTPVELQTLGGRTAGSPAIVGSLRVGDLELRDAPVVLHDPGPGLDGILGNTFLSRYQVTVDADRRQLHLRPIVRD